MLTTIFWLLILAGLLTIVYIYWRNLPKVLVVDQESLPVTKEAAVKKKLIEQRIKRQFVLTLTEAWIKFGPYWQKISQQVVKFFSLIIAYEEKYRARLLKENFKKKVNQQQYIFQVLSVAKALFDQEKFVESEKKFLDVLTLDDHNLEAYQGLAKLYYVQNQFEQAQQTLQFVSRLDPHNVDNLSQLAEVAKARGDLATAIGSWTKVIELKPENIETYFSLAQVYFSQEEFLQAQSILLRAFSLEQNNPRLLDFLIEISILLRDKDNAYRSYLHLKNVNPDNAKLDDFQDRINRL